MTTPYAPVWDDSAAPGGYVCSICRTPVESDPCPRHSPAGQLRAAAVQLRDTKHHGTLTGDCDNTELLQLITNLLHAREPLAAWLDAVADEITDYGDRVIENTEGRLYVCRPEVRDWTAALKTARTILGGAR